MDFTTYEETEISVDVLGDDLKFLQENMEVKGLILEGKVLTVELPMFIQGEITETDPGLKGDSSKAGTKPAIIDTGATVLVPLFVQIGDKIKIDTRTGTYVERVK